MSYDPATSVVKLKSLIRELNDEMAPAAQPDYHKIALLTVDIKEQANEIKYWAYCKEYSPHGS